MSDTQWNQFSEGMKTPKGPRKAMPVGLVIVGLVVVIAIVAVLLAFPGGGDYRTPHAPVSPAMGGAPSESDHTNADADDLVNGFGKGTDAGATADDNIEHVNGASTAIVADSTATK
jgi:hypothetical protein